MPIANFFIVGAGGALGAMARYGVNLAVPPAGNGFPTATLLINIAGGLLMGLLAGTLARISPEVSEGWRLFLGVGILGGFTTFSAFSLETVLLFERGETAVALLYVVLSVVFSIAAASVGLFAVRQFA